ncbi:MAG: response regulator [Patescibacteria group bacterium]
MSELKKKILVVEDEKPMAHALELKLKSSGFDADVAHDGEAALEHILTNSYDLVLLDLVIPKKDGFGVLAELKEKGNTTPIFVTSNLSQQEDEKKARELGAQGYLIKSNTPLLKIIETIKEFLHVV